MSKHMSEQNTKSKTFKIAIIATIALVIVTISVVAAVVFTGNNDDKSATPDTATPSQAAATQDSVATPDQSSTQAQQPTEIEVSCSDDLTAYLTKAGKTIDDINKLECSQLVVVDSNGTSADIKFYEVADDMWQQDEKLSCNGFVGQKGTVEQMSEYISGTPKGLYTVDEAFYVYDKPQTGLDTFEITANTYWVDDPESSHYNKRVDGTDNMDWSSAEHMIDYASSYKYGFVIGYNKDYVKGAGSAIFFHVGSAPTQGCVSTSEDNVLAYLAKLDAAKHPYIIIM